MKDKLIELLRRSIVPECMVEPLAEYLEENGVVIPVRCGECIYGQDTGFICIIGRGEYLEGSGTFPNDTCKYGERRADNGKKELS